MGDSGDAVPCARRRHAHFGNELRLPHRIGLRRHEVPRSTGWHRFEWVYGADDGLEMKIDGTTVATHATSPTFDRIQLGDWWADNRTGSVYFDDVSIG